MLKRDDIFFYAIAEDGKISVNEYVVRTIRGGHVYLISKNSATWGKVSSKIGDYGWLKQIPPAFREKFKVADGPPAGFSKTQNGA